MTNLIPPDILPSRAQGEPQGHTPQHPRTPKIRGLMLITKVPAAETNQRRPPRALKRSASSESHGFSVITPVIEGFGWHGHVRQASSLGGLNPSTSNGIIAKAVYRRAAAYTQDPACLAIQYKRILSGVFEGMQILPLARRSSTLRYDSA